MTAVSVTGLRKSFGRLTVLDGVDLDGAAGSLTAVLGPSGSGKTTLLRILAGFERADGGCVTIGGHVVEDDRTHVRPARRRIGYVPQEGALFPHLSVAKNVAFGIRDRRARRVRVEQLIDLVGLTGLADRLPHQLSGGQQQRVALARALAVDPLLVLLDEPFTSLDPAMRSTVRADVAAILAAAGTTAVLVTHDQDEALSCASTVAVISRGRIAQQGTPQEVYDRPVDGDVARFIGAANLVAGTGAGSSVRTALGRLPLLAPTTLPVDAPAVVMVRPEQVRVVSGVGEGAGEEEDNRGLEARVTKVEFLGHDVVVTAAARPRCGTADLVARGDRADGVAVGDAVRLVVASPVHAWVAPEPVTGPVPGGGGSAAPVR